MECISSSCRIIRGPSVIRSSCIPSNRLRPSPPPILPHLLPPPFSFLLLPSPLHPPCMLFPLSLNLPLHLPSPLRLTIIVATIITAVITTVISSRASDKRYTRQHERDRDRESDDGAFGKAGAGGLGGLGVAAREVCHGRRGAERTPCCGWRGAESWLLGVLAGTEEVRASCRSCWGWGGRGHADGDLCGSAVSFWW